MKTDSAEFLNMYNKSCRIGGAVHAVRTRIRLSTRYRIKRQGSGGGLGTDTSLVFWDTLFARSFVWGDVDPHSWGHVQRTPFILSTKGVDTSRFANKIQLSSTKWKSAKLVAQLRGKLGNKASCCSVCCARARARSLSPLSLSPLS